MTRSTLCVGDEGGGRIAECPQLVQSRGEPWSLVDQYVDCRRNPLQCTLNDVTLSGQGARESIEVMDRCDDVVSLLVQHADELVHLSQQVPDRVFTSGEGCVEVVDDVADLAQPTRR